LNDHPEVPLMTALTPATLFSAELLFSHGGWGQCAPAHLETSHIEWLCSVYKRREWGGTELFRSPVISFVYERGWRQVDGASGHTRQMQSLAHIPRCQVCCEDCFKLACHTCAPSFCRALAGQGSLGWTRSLTWVSASPHARRSAGILLPAKSTPSQHNIVVPEATLEHLCKAADMSACLPLNVLQPCAISHQPGAGWWWT
jgi:hypothetical protein